MKPRLRWDTSNKVWWITSEDTPYAYCADTPQMCYLKWQQRSTYEEIAQSVTDKLKSKYPQESITYLQKITGWFK